MTVHKEAMVFTPINVKVMTVVLMSLTVIIKNFYHALY